MTYTGDSPIVSQGQATAQQITAFVAARGKVLAAGYAPDGQYRDPPADLAQAIVDECHRYPDHVVNHDLVTSQIVIETAGWQSRYARERNNPGGIGAINSNPDLAITFPTVAAGIRAHVAHLLVYAVGDGPWVADDPRAANVAHEGWYGIAPTLRGLNGRWAFPGTTYGQGIASGANALLETEAPTVADGLSIRVAIIPEGNPNRPGDAIQPRIEFITVHETANTAKGANAEMHRAFTHNGGGQGRVSFHWCVDDHEAVQLLPPNEIGWHAGDGCNDPATDKGCFASEAIETCVNSDGDWNKTLDNLAALIVNRLRFHSLGIDAVVQHNRWSGKNCPARLRSNGGVGWKALVAEVTGRMNGAPSPTPASDALIVNGHVLRLGFKAFWQELEAEHPDLPTRVLGLPLSDEFSWQEDGKDRSAQLFERGILLWLEEGDVRLAPRKYHAEIEARAA